MNSSQKQKRFMTLYTPLQDRLWRFCLFLTGNTTDAEELRSETILVAYERLDSLRADTAFLSFLFTVASRVYARWRKHRRRFVPVEDAGLENLLQPGASPEDAADIYLLMRALEELPPAQREAVTLFEIVGLSRKEISRIQGSTVANVKVRLYRGRKKLARLLGVTEPPAKASAAEGKHALRPLVREVNKPSSG